MIREYQSQDRDSILELFRLNTPISFAESEKEDLKRYLDEHLENYFVLEQEDRILACGGYNRSENPGIMRISWDMVHPNHQGKGFGKQLLEHRLNKIKENSIVQVVTVRTSQLAFRFYEKSGFRLLEVKPDFWAPGFDLYRMQLEIQPE